MLSRSASIFLLGLLASFGATPFEERLAVERRKLDILGEVVDRIKTRIDERPNRLPEEIQSAIGMVEGLMSQDQFYIDPEFFTHVGVDVLLVPIRQIPFGFLVPRDFGKALDDPRNRIFLESEVVRALVCFYWIREYGWEGDRTRREGTLASKTVTVQALYCRLFPADELSQDRRATRLLRAFADAPLGDQWWKYLGWRFRKDYQLLSAFEEFWYRRIDDPRMTRERIYTVYEDLLIPAAQAAEEKTTRLLEELRRTDLKVLDSNSEIFWKLILMMNTVQTYMDEAVWLEEKANYKRGILNEHDLETWVTYGRLEKRVETLYESIRAHDDWMELYRVQPRTF